MFTLSRQNLHLVFAVKADYQEPYLQQGIEHTDGIDRLLGSTKQICQQQQRILCCFAFDLYCSQ